MSQHSTIVGLGARTDHVATVPYTDPVRLGLSEEEAALFQAVGRVSRIDDVLARSGLSEARTIAILLSLRAKGAIVPARVNKQEGGAEYVDAAALEEVDLDPARKKEILDLERILEKVDHFSVLGVPPGASPAVVKEAYYEASRRYHPDRYYGKNLGSFRGRIERIFKRLSEAHTVLTQPARRDAYLQAHPELAPPPPPREVPPPAAVVSPLSAERQAERQARLARHPYLMKGQRTTELVSRGRALLDRGEYERALNELTQATRLDPSNRELANLVQEARRQMDAQRSRAALEQAEAMEKGGDMASAALLLRQAVQSDPQNAALAFKAARAGRSAGHDVKELRPLAQKAVELAPLEASHHALLAHILLDGGAKKLAKRHFEETLRLQPEHAEAKAQLKKLRWTF